MNKLCPYIGLSTQRVDRSLRLSQECDCQFDHGPGKRQEDKWASRPISQNRLVMPLESDQAHQPLGISALMNQLPP